MKVDLAAMSAFRIRVALANHPDIPLRWLLVDPAQCRTVGDIGRRLLAVHPSVRAELAQSASGTVSLSLDGAVLPDDEAIAILRDGETASPHVRAHQCRYVI